MNELTLLKIKQLALFVSFVVLITALFISLACYFEQKQEFSIYKSNVQSVDSIKSSEIEMFVEQYKQSQAELIYYKTYHNMVKSRYNIDVKTSTEGKTTTYWIEASQVDSALLLLELYRDRIYYNSKDHIWSVYGHSHSVSVSSDHK